MYIETLKKTVPCLDKNPLSVLELFDISYSICGNSGCSAHQVRKVVVTQPLK